jgi:murein DD-endopeptidase MepM/ murein hydrolase activator NlpD
VPTEVPTAAPEKQYVFPVQADKGTISYGRTHHDYPAADIFCPVGSLFVAPIGGVIDFTTSADVWDPATDVPADRGGLSVALIGDDGVRYYGSHLSRVAEGIAAGVRVAAGQTLGLTGNSGNARSTPPHLHFGISHPTTPDDWAVRRGEIAPYRYLRAWQRGQNLAPDISGLGE